MRSIVTAVLLTASLLVSTGVGEAQAAGNVYHKILADDYNGAVLPYVTLYSTYTQAIAATDAVQYLELNSSSNGGGKFTQINKSTWSAVDPGVYEFCFSGIADSTTQTAQEIEMWGRINDVDVPDSNTRIRLASAATEHILSVCWIGPLNAGDTFNAMTYGSSTDLRWLYIAAQTEPVRPAAPSVIMSVKKVSAVH